MNRRSFLRASAGATAGSLFLAGSACRSEDAPADVGSGLDRIGLQLYTVRDLMGQDVSATLGQVSEIGYTEVEFAGYFDHTPEQIRDLLEEYGLTSPSSHVALEFLRRDLEGTLEAMNVIGHQYVTVPFLAPAERTTADGYRRLAEEFNTIAEACRGAGLQFAYHNHDFEFERVDGEVGYDLLLAGTDPELVQMELDLFWARSAGVDPVAYFMRHPGRFAMCHVKDMNAQEEMVAVGDGVIDFADIFTHIDHAGLRHFFVEHDRPADALASVTASYRHLAALRF